MVDSISVAVLTGSFALGGILLSSLIALVTTASVRKWDADREARARRTQSAMQLRAERRTCYAVALETFNRQMTAISDIQDRQIAKRKAGESIKIEVEDLDYGLTEDLENAILSALLVAGPETASKLRELDRKVLEIWVVATKGGDLTTLSDPFNRLRDELLEAMRSELSLALEA